jgi:glycosyltransferase 2 family protein
MRKFLFALALLLGVVYLLSRLADLQTIALTLQQGKWFFLLPAVTLQAAWLLNIGMSYRTIYKILGLHENYNRLVRLASASTFLNVIAPTGGMSGISVFVSDARRRNYSTARVMVAGSLFVLFDYIGFLVVLMVGLGVLARRNILTWPEISASILLAAGALGLGSVLYLGMHSGKTLGVVLSRISRGINWMLRPFIHRTFIPEERALTFAHDAEDGLKALKTNPKEVVLLVLLAILGKALLIGVMLMTFLAFDVPLSTGTLIAGFSIGYLFLIVSPTPSGLGFVEGALALTLNSLYVPLAEATVVVVAYRSVTFWFPLLLGMISFRTLSKFGGANKVEN